MLLNGASSGMIEAASNPECLREGTAVTDFLYPDRIFVGADTSESANVLRDIYKPLLDGSYYRQTDAIPAPSCFTPPPPILITSAKSAELIKYAS
jgi:UDPglucose 6-dehydrogenase